jgi:hypothetical protein
MGVAMKCLRVLALAALLAGALSACDLPFGLGLPSTRALEAGVRASVASTRFEITGSYLEGGQAVSFDLQVERPDTEHLMLTGASVRLEAIVLGSSAYFRGQDFLAAHMSTDPLSQNLVKAAGNAWWKGSTGLFPPLAELMQPDAFQRTFLGPAVSDRTDHIDVDGVDAADLSGPRGEVYVALAPPYRLLGIRFDGKASIDGLQHATLAYGSYGQDFSIAAPADLIDFSNLSTLPPIYQVVSVDTSRCGNPCAVSALLKNLGGKSGAQAPSTVTFTMTATATNAVIGSCQVQVIPDVGYNSTTTVSCTIANVARSANAAIVTAVADNPGRA